MNVPHAWRPRQSGPAACRDCDCWGFEPWCQPCRTFARKYPRGDCRRCGHRGAPVKDGWCRACIVHVHWHGPESAAQSWTQLWLGAGLAPSMGAASATTGYQAQGRPGRYRAQAMRNAAKLARPAAEHLEIRGQEPLFDVKRDWARIDLGNLPGLTLAARALVDELKAMAGDRGWRHGSIRDATRLLRVAVAWLGADAPIRETDLVDLVDAHPGLSAKRRVAQFLDARGMLIPRPAPPADNHERAVTAYLSEFTGPVADQLDAWISVLRGNGRHRRRPLPWASIRRYVSYLRPVLRDWAQQYDDLKQVTGDDVQAAIAQVSGSSAGDRHVAVRSLFTALKQQRLVFANPAAHIRLKGHQQPAKPIPPDHLASLLERTNDPLTRLVITVVSVHAVTPGQLRASICHDIDLAAGVMRLPNPRRPKIHLDELSIAMLQDWFRHRATTWPRTANPHLLINSQTAHDTTHPPITAVHVHHRLQQLGVHATGLRSDRILYEARLTVDPVHLMRLFGIAAHTALNYVTSAHPDRIHTRPSGR